MKPTPIASAYRFPDRIVLHSHGLLPSWIHIACDPYISLPPTASPEQIGQAVRTVLHSYRPEMPDPADFKKVREDFVRNMGVKSNKRLQETSINCGLRAENGTIKFEPTHNGGTSGDSKGFQATSGTAFSIPSGGNDAELGNALLRAFDLCTSIYSND